MEPTQIHMYAHEGNLIILSADVNVEAKKSSHFAETFAPRKAGSLHSICLWPIVT